MKTALPLASRLFLGCMLALSADAYAAATFTPNDQPTGWVGEVDVSNFNFGGGGQTIFKADYIKGEWSGNLFAFPVDPDGTVQFVAERWSNGVASNLDAQNYDTGRIIVTMRSDGSRIPFRWASLEATQQSALGTSTTGPKVVNYLRGDRSNEKPSGALYRARKQVLGDIVHSRPVFVYDAVNPRVYVGANDGMLHAFDANVGMEVFAYMPSFFISPAAPTSFSQVTALKSDPYVHTYFVDGSPNVASIKVSGAWKTILVGGVGPGGKGLYALDVTNPTAADEATTAGKILWEITPTTVNNASSTAYSDLGHTYGVPLIVTLNDGTPAAIVGNGYNGTGGNQAVLYVINLMTGAKIAGIATSSPTAVSDTNPNGLSSPTAIDADHDGKVDYVYAGDINGNLWKFDIRNVGSPVVARLYTTSPAQPITGRPLVSLHPLGGYMVNFATGRMFTSADATDATTVYHAYGLWDNGTTINSANIVSQTLAAKTWTGASGFNYNVRVSSSNTVDYTLSTPKQGWKLELPAGERVVGDGGLVTNGRFVFASTNPTIAHAPVGGVEQPQGDNWLNEVVFTDGGGGSAPVFDLDSNLALDDADRVRASGGSLAQTGPTGVPVSRYIASGAMSQPIVAMLAKLSETYFNTNPDWASASPGSVGDPGVSGGHFDFDIWFNTCRVATPSANGYAFDDGGSTWGGSWGGGSSTGGPYDCQNRTHVHEYDDMYNVTGVNMLAPSLAAFNIANAIPSTTTQFKILMANQKFNPATKFSVGGAAYVPVTSYQTTAGITMASRTTYTRSNIGSLTLALPMDAFQSKDWAGTGDVRSGLVPTVYSCVWNNQGAWKGQSGPWLNGALTIQLVKANTPDSRVEYNVAGDPSMGYRLKKDKTSQSYQLGEYALYWHHPNGKCYGDAGWVKNPPQDLTGSDAAAKTPAAGASDPQDGLFGTTGTVAGSGGGALSGPTSTVTYTFADGSSVTQTTTRNADGSVTVDRVYSNGGTESFEIPPSSGGKQADTRAKTGRVSWREMIRP